MADSSSPGASLAHGVLALTAQIVSAHVGSNKVAADDLPGLIEQVFDALSAAGGGAGPGGFDRKIRIPRSYRLPGGRKETKNAETASAERA